MEFLEKVQQQIKDAKLYRSFLISAEGRPAAEATACSFLTSATVSA